MTDVVIIAGSESDAELVRKVEATLHEFGVKYESHVASAHRSPEKVKEVVKNSKAKVFIGIAGLSAALPGAIASYTTRPVIGLPRNVKLEGLDSLLSMMQMPPGVPVATVGIDNAKNAALLAVEILAVGDEKIRNKLEEFRSKK
ncbi:MAG: 5-(carboxyamino)imidazole ribonucleotide mutase [Candidatus Hydrothermarchaeota archaeon]|nr:5-(carboxyamino)imidazole ribonucleotide mutase [Candidatus Hydrothermarchaeota archaeon]